VEKLEKSSCQVVEKVAGAGSKKNLRKGKSIVKVGVVMGVTGGGLEPPGKIGKEKKVNSLRKRGERGEKGKR